ncbi:hypothetical protein [Nocardioides alcanivorans]|uniref:hypothetical protein n=1 Tax=Nocardioides alcanivorans TaxID=2897352 RepID=UPI001F1847F6|nr:hypothetical protein [Nocardioides alcanivorans]
MSALAVGALTAALLLGSAPPAQAAKVTKKNVPGRSALVKIFPELNGELPEKYASDEIWVPTKTCGDHAPVVAKSAYSFSLGGYVDSGAAVEVAAFKSVKRAKSAFRAYKRVAKKCSKFTTSSGRKFKVKRLDHVPKVGEQRFGMLKIERGPLLTDHRGRHVDRVAVVVIRKGKRLAVAQAYREDAKVPQARVKKLVKVTAKKMR